MNDNPVEVWIDGHVPRILVIPLVFVVAIYIGVCWLFLPKTTFERWNA